MIEKQGFVIDEFYPNFYEVQQAGKILKEEFAKEIPSIEQGINSIDTAVTIAASRVWQAGRRYQSEKMQASKNKQPRRRFANLISLLPLKAVDVHKNS